MQDVRRSRTAQFEEDTCVRPLLRPWQARRDDDHSAEELPDSQNAEDVHGVAQMRDDSDDRWAGDEFRPAMQQVRDATDECLESNERRRWHHGPAAWRDGTKTVS